MTLDHKKLELINRITVLEDEQLIDAAIDLVSVKENTQEANNPVARYKTVVEPTVDLSKIKAEQMWSPPDVDKIDRLIEEADIQEPIEELLEDLRA